MFHGKHSRKTDGLRGRSPKRANSSMGCPHEASSPRPGD